MTGRRAAGSGKDPLVVTRSVRLPLSEISLRTSRSSGPGGQHANTSATRVEAVFDVAASATLGPRQKQRVIRRLGPVVSAIAQDERSQLRNRELAVERLGTKLAAALAVPKRRRPTKPTAAARERRLVAKRRTAELKRGRQKPDASA